ncbi:polyprenyl synthetase family protein [Nocardia asiatica]|uniref:polyprenyl synthetase family protein n=1 Tax=Nocardia asiatica TaxID=209252 RepID=UPI0002F2C221|nr:polyprenyl synthetase family protein [Nocardia asiatica]
MSTIDPVRTRPATMTQGTPADVLPTDASDLLSEARAVVAPALRLWVATLPYTIRRIANYHFDWTDHDGSPNSGGSWGKGLRAALVLACARAVGGQTAAAVPAAAAVELVHNASLIQDDVFDQDTMRRHRPSVWAAYDPAAAVLVGDALFFSSIEALLSSPHSVPAIGTLIDVVKRLLAGERADIEFESRRDVSLPECMAMTAAKTGALIEGACALGARYGEATPEQIGALGSFGHHLGIAFQLVDDYLGIWGVEGVTGKPVLADLRRRKKSLPVVAALQARTPAATELASFYFDEGPMTDAQAMRAARLIEQTGAQDWVLAEGRTHAAKALEKLVEARPTVEGKTQLAALARLVTDRCA